MSPLHTRYSAAPPPLPTLAHPRPSLSKHTHHKRAAMDNNNQASTNYREAFQLFDKRGNGRVDRSALGDLLRACGQNPTLAEIGDLERGVGADCTSHFPHIPRSLPLTTAQLTLRLSPRSSTAPAASASPSTLKNTSAASKCSTRTGRALSERARSSTF